MGREIRRVPAGWEHPQQDCPHGSGLEGHKRFNTPGDYQYGKCFKPLLDADYETEAAAWMNEASLWHEGRHPDQNPEYPYYWDWAGNPPDKKYYRPKWTDEERTHFQIYETVSEGTPVSPVFSSTKELIEYLVAHNTSRSAAEKFVELKWVPSMMSVGGEMKSNIDSLDLIGGIS